MGHVGIAYKIKDHYLNITCGTPGCASIVTISCNDGLVPEHVAKRMSNKGWEFDIDHADRTFCPACISRRKASKQFALKESEPLPMALLLVGTEISTHVVVSIEPSKRHQGACMLVIESPKQFLAESGMFRAHGDRGFAITFEKGQKAVHPAIHTAFKRWEFEQPSVFFQMDGPVQSKRLEAVMYGKAIAVNELPDEFLPPQLRKKKLTIVPTPPAAPPAPVAPVENKAFVPPPAPLGMTLIKITMSTFKTQSGKLGLRLNFPRSTVKGRDRYLVEREGEKGLCLQPSAEGNIVQKIADGERIGWIALAPRKMWFDPPTTPFHHVRVPAHLDETTGMIHVPCMPPMALKNVAPISEAAELPLYKVAVPAAIGDVPYQNKAKMRQLLEQYFREDLGTFSNNYSDRRIADEASVPIAAVAQMRELAFGPLHPKTAEMAKIDEEMHVLRQRLAVLESDKARLKNEITTGGTPS